MPVDMTSRYLPTPNGTNVHYKTWGNGDGPLLVFLHGLGGSTNTFTALLERLSPDVHRGICVDFEGLGQTKLSSADVELSISRYVADLEYLVAAQLAERLDKRVILVGHSLGSIVALHFAAGHANTVAGLCLLAVGRSASHIEEARQRMLDLGARARNEGSAAVADLAAVSNFPRNADTPPAHRDTVRSEVAASDPEGYARTCEAIVSTSHSDPEYAKIRCPTVFVSGEDDVLSPLQRAKDLSSLIGGDSKFVVVRGGHQPIISDLDGVEQGLRQLLLMVEETRGVADGA